MSNQFNNSVKIPCKADTKKPLKSCSSWNTWTETPSVFSKTTNKNIGLQMGKTNKFTTIDLDLYKATPEQKQIWENYIKTNKEPITTKQLTPNQGEHLIFKYTDKLKSINGLYGFIDVKNDNSYILIEPSSINGKSYKFVNNTEPHEMPESLIELLKTDSKYKQSKDSCYPEKNIEYYIEMMDIIDEDYYIDFLNDAITIVWSCKTISKELKEPCREIMKKSDKYNKDPLWFDRTWKQGKDDKLTIGTMLHFAKLSNESKYREIARKYYQDSNFDFSKFTEVNIGDLFDLLYGEDFMVNKENLYYWTGVYWEKQSNYNKIYLKITKDLFEYLEEIINKMDFDEDDDGEKKEKNLKSQILQLQSERFIKPCINYIKMILNKDIDLDEKWNLFVFDNKVYDLEAHTFITPSKTDYMTLSTGKKYQKPTSSQIDRVNGLLDQIFTDPEERSIYLQILSTGLENRQICKFVIANGNGGNGKSLIHEFFMYLLGHYSYVGDNEMIQGSNKKSHEISLMHNKRFVLFSEPDANRSLSESTVKSITGTEQINARSIYSKDTKTILKNLTIIECNKNPRFSEATDALARRLIDYHFKSSFVEDTSKYKGLDNVFQAQDIKNTQFYKEHVNALFEIIVNAHKIYQHNNYKFKLTDELENRTKEYLEGCGELNVWLNESLLKTDNKNDRVQIKDLFNEFKRSEFFQNMNKKDKRQLTLKGFSNEIITHFEYKKFYVKRLHTTDKEFTNLLQYHKFFKQDNNKECDSDSDDDHITNSSPLDD